MKARNFISGALMALWLAMVVPQVGMLAAAFAGPPALTDSQFITGILILIPQIPGVLILGAICDVLRNSCNIGQPLGSDQATSIVIVLVNAGAYLAVTYWVAKFILANISKTERSFQTASFAGGVLALLASSSLTAWMLWASKPYYVHSLPGLSVLSLLVAVLTFFFLFWDAGVWGPQ